MLKKDKALQELAETPLMLSIMTLAYKDKKADDLIAPRNLEEQRKHLFDTYIERMFDRSARSTNTPFTEHQTLHYLSFLANKMIQHNIITYQIASMQPSWLKQPQERLYRRYVGMIAGLLLVLIGMLLLALTVGLIFTLMGGLFGWLSGWPIGGLILGVSLGMSLGMAPVLVIGLGLAGGLTSEEVEATTYPEQRLKQTLLNSLFSTLIYGLSVGLILGLIYELFIVFIGGLHFALSFGLNYGMKIALFGGLIFGLIGGLNAGYLDLIEHYSLRFVLTRNKSLPWRLVLFLGYAVDLIFLRRVGGSYIFVHRLLMEHFAEMDV
ncbi:MAG: hypothetical protein L0287_30170 [Anaerolineae bacterium]|nr:hypothetical protein [Anaerolineae bacterium]